MVHLMCQLCVSTSFLSSAFREDRLKALQTCIQCWWIFGAGASFAACTSTSVALLPKQVVHGLAAFCGWGRVAIWVKDVHIQELLGCILQHNGYGHD